MLGSGLRVEDSLADPAGGRGVDREGVRFMI